MRKTPLYQGKEQPLKNHVAGAAADIRLGGSGGSEGLSSPDLVSSIGSMQASVYIQMLFQYYLFLKCFQDLKAVHVFRYHCHTPLLFLES